MRRIYVGDGASFVWQWQPKEQIVLEGYPDGVFVRYANCDTVEAPVVQTRREGDKLVADIPPELMQVDKDITVYVCNEDGIIHCHFLSVISSPKPSSYVYEPVEVLRYDSLAERIRLIEEWIAGGGGGPGGGIKEETDPTVAAWAKEGQPEPYGANNPPPYPVISVNGKTGAVDLKAEDVGALPAGTKIPGKISDLTNDAGFINKSVSDLVNYFTKKQTEDLIAQIPKFRIAVVQQLPATGEELVLYLVPFATAEGQYLEYIWTGGRFEVIGSQKVDLTGYATEDWVQQGYQPKGSYLLSTALPGAIEEALAQAKASGKFDGRDGEDGTTPHIGANGNWYTGNTDTGIKAQGPAGAAGRGIKSNIRTSGNGAAGTVDTYTTTYTDGTTSTYQVRNGANGTNGQAATLAITGVVALAAGAAPTVAEDSGSTAQNRKYIIGIPAGKTPVAGIDYFTDADKAAMVQQVIDEFPKYAGEVEVV